MTKAYWMWNYGDYEIFHSNKANTRREEFGIDYPVFWRLPEIDRNVFFYCDFENSEPEKIKAILNGFGYLSVDGKLYKANEEHVIEPGKHNARITVTNLSGLPAAFVESDICPSGEKWVTLNPEKTKTLPVGYEKQYDTPDKNPEQFIFEYKRIYPVNTDKREDGTLYDFGKEVYGYLLIDSSTDDKLHVSYGESLSEAVDIKFSTVQEDISGKTSYRLRPRAFRYIFIPGSHSDLKVSADFEYLPLEYKGSFHSDSDDVNKIWDMCAYTLLLTSREVQLEAVKRDRWLWGGDAYQAYKFNNYLFFDKEIIRRSTIALRGKEPVYEHINTIADYSLFWIIGLYEYYLFYKDDEFIKFIYPKAVSLLDFCRKRVNGEGFIKRVPGDWIFIDWANIDKSGESCISAEQMLYIAANNSMAKLSEIVGDDKSKFEKEAQILKEKVNAFFWDGEKGAYIDNYESGKRNVTRHANIFAILYDIASKEQAESICKNVLFNDEIEKITTPYFEGYELEVMGKLSEFDFIENKIRTYWKGMLDLGATTVWEEFDPSLTGDEHYAMYGKKYDKSLCHAWGAAPIYLLGRFFMGVYPTSPGFETFSVKPHLGGFGFIEGCVPIMGGEVKIKLDGNSLSVTATKGGGTLSINGKDYTLKKDKELTLEI